MLRPHRRVGGAAIIESDQSLDQISQIKSTLLIDSSGEDTRRRRREGRQRRAVGLMKCAREWKDGATSTSAQRWRLQARDALILILVLKLSSCRTKREKAPLSCWGKRNKSIHTSESAGGASHQSKALGGRRPPLDRGEGPLLHHVFGPLVHSHHGLFGDAQETRNQLVFALHLFLCTSKRKKKNKTCKFRFPQRMAYKEKKSLCKCFLTTVCFSPSENSQVIFYF